MGEAGSNLAASRDRAHGLGSGHYGHGQHLDRVLLNQGCNRFGGMQIEISIHDRVFFAALENRGDRQNGERQAAIAVPSRLWIIENDHLRKTGSANS